jgi:hypothetical protein
MRREEENMTDAFTQESLSVLKQDIVKALTTIEKKHGVTLSVEKLNRPQFHRAEFKLVALRESPHRAEYLAHAQKLGLQLDWLGRTFVDAPTIRSPLVDMMIVGLDRSNSTKPVLCEIVKDNGTATGRGYLYSIEAVAEKMNNQSCVAARHQHRAQERP